MADEGNSNVIARGLSSIRNAVTGQSSEPDQVDQEDEQAQAGAGEVDQADPTEVKQQQSGTVEAEQDQGATEKAAQDGHEVEETSETTQRTAAEYADIMQQCAAGDLTVRMEANGEDEAIDRIALEFNDMVSELEQTTGQLKSYVEEVESAGVGVERSADTVRRASDDVVDGMQNVSAIAADQREQMVAISEAMDEIAATLESDGANGADSTVEAQIDRLEQNAAQLREVAGDSETIQTEATIASAASEEQAAELGEVSSRASDLQRYANPFKAILDRFTTGSVEDPSASSRETTDAQQQ